MSNALHENLANVRIETDDGDLLPAMDVAGEKLAQLILAVSANQKPGTLTLKITVRPSTAGALAVKADVATKLPKGLPAETLLWPSITSSPSACSGTVCPASPASTTGTATCLRCAPRCSGGRITWIGLSAGRRWTTWSRCGGGDG